VDFEDCKKTYQVQNEGFADCRVVQMDAPKSDQHIDTGGVQFNADDKSYTVFILTETDGYTIGVQRNTPGSVALDYVAETIQKAIDTLPNHEIVSVVHTIIK
jgi:hypothetical protein